MARRLRRLAIAALSLGLVLLALLVFASSETGFRTLLQPLLARAGVEVAGGRVSLEGEIAARELRWSGGSIARLEASLDPWSLLPGRRLHLRALVVEGLAVELVADAATEPPEAQQPESDAGLSLPALQVGSAQVELVSLRQLDAEGQPVWALGPATLALEGWEPGAAGALSIATDFALPAAEPARTGTLAFEGAVGVPADADGSLTLDGALDATLAPDGLALHAEIDGESALGDGGLSLSSPLELRHDDQLILEGVQLDLAFGGDGLSVDLAVERAPAAALLAAFGVERPSARGIELGLALEGGLAPESNQITLAKLRLEQRPPGAAPVVATAEGTITPGASPTADLALTGPGADGGEGSATFTLADGAAKLAVASLDLTPLVDPWLGADEGAPEEERDDEEPGADLALDFEIGALRFRELLVREARGTLRRKDGRLELDLPAARLGEGTLAGTFQSGVADGQRELAWKLDAKRIDLGEIFRSLDPTSEGQLAGRLDLTSEASARVPAGADPLDALEGQLAFALRDAKANDLPFQRYMASELAVGGLASLAFTGAEGTIPITGGEARIGRLFIDGNAASFAVSGALSADEIDLAVNPRLGPRLASDLAPRFATTLFETASGALALPVAFRILGPWGETRYAMRPVPPSLVGDVLGVTADMVSGAARFLFRRGDGAGDEASAEGAAPAAEPAAPPEAPARHEPDPT